MREFPEVITIEFLGWRFTVSKDGGLFVQTSRFASPSKTAQAMMHMSPAMTQLLRDALALADAQPPLENVFMGEPYDWDSLGY